MYLIRERFCETVPAFRARGHRGDLRLSTRPTGEGA
jgi:hypothetical protein